MDVNNDTCWFYPTVDGEYLSLDSRNSIVMEPGYLADDSSIGVRYQYEQCHLNLLRSLLANTRIWPVLG